MKEKLTEIILKMHALRPNSAQFVFSDTIMPPSTGTVRSSIIEFKKVKPDVKEVDFIIYSPGGLADDAYKIIRTLRTSFDIVNVIVPYWAKSAATLLSLGASRIIMDDFGEFGPLDAQVGKAREDSPEYDRESALNDENSLNIVENRFKMMYESMYIRLYEHKKINIPKGEVSKQLLENLSKFYEPLIKQIDPYKLGDKKRKLDIGAQYAMRILLQYGSLKDKDIQSSRRFVDFLINGCPDHAYVIDRDFISKFLTNVHPPEFFGDDYKTALQDLSIFFYNIEESLSLISFIMPVEANGAEQVGDNFDIPTITNKNPETRKIKQNGKKAITNKSITS